MNNNKINKSIDIQNVYPLPDEIFIRIFSNLSFKDLVTTKTVTKKFCLLIEKYYFLMNREKPLILYITNKSQQSLPSSFSITISLVVQKNETNFSKKNISNRNELVRSLRMFNMINLNSIIITSCNNIGIYNVINTIFPQKLSIKSFCINTFTHKDIKDFEIFVKKLEKIEELEIRHICYNKNYDINYLWINLSCITSLQKVVFTECKNTKFLNLKFLLELFERNIQLKYIDIRSPNKNFIKDIGNNFIEKEELIEYEICNHNDIQIHLYTEGEVGDIFVNTNNNNFENIRNYQFLATLHHEEISFEKLCKLCHQNWRKWDMSCKSKDFSFHDNFLS